MWSRASTSFSKRSVDPIGNDSSISPCSSVRTVSNPAASKTSRAARFSAITSATKLDDADGARTGGELLEHPRADSPALLAVGDRERDLRPVRVAEPRVAREREDRAVVDTATCNQGAALLPVRIEVRLDQGRIDRPQAVEAQVKTALGEAGEELDQLAGIGGSRRPQPKRAAVSEDESTASAAGGTR